MDFRVTFGMCEILSEQSHSITAAYLASIPKMDSYPPNVFVCSHLIAKDQVGMIYFDEDGNE